MASYGFIKILSNDGSTRLFDRQTNSFNPTFSVTSTGVTDGSSSYTYEGTKQFLGVSTSANTTEPTYPVGSEFTVSLDTTEWLTLYIVEGDKAPIFTYDLSQLNLPVGIHLITVIAKADGYADSAPSNAVEYVVEETGVVIPAGTYVANDVLTKENNIRQEISYVSNSVSYNTMTATENLIYMQTVGATSAAMAYSFRNGTWFNTAYKIITTSIDQTVTAEFGEWFNANFTKKAETPTNLTGYTVTVPTGWSATAGYGAYDLNGSFNGIEGMVALGIGNSKQTFTTTAPFADRITWSNGGKFQTDLTPADSFSVYITGGMDAANSSLIQWFIDNNAIFEKTLISFTIKGTTYQAEEGMTWEQWIASDYNTDGFKIIGNFIKLNDTDIDYVLDPSTTMEVNITDKIIANYSYYYTFHAGGSN